MIAISFSILALAAGVYLLIQVKHFGFTGIYKALSWLVILLSLAFMIAGGVRGVMHHRHERHCEQSGSCDMKGGSCSYMREGHCDMKGGDMGHCAMSGAGNMPCCAKDSGEKKCEAGKSACCHKGGEAADSTAHK